MAKVKTNYKLTDNKTKWGMLEIRESNGKLRKSKKIKKTDVDDFNDGNTPEALVSYIEGAPMVILSERPLESGDCLIQPDGTLTLNTQIYEDGVFALSFTKDIPSELWEEVNGSIYIEKVLS